MGRLTYVRHPSLPDGRIHAATFWEGLDYAMDRHLWGAEVTEYEVIRNEVDGYELLSTRIVTVLEPELGDGDPP